MRQRLLHDEYVRRLLESRKNELIQTDIINERNMKQGLGLTSPTSNLSTEETRLLREYMDKRNVLKIGEAAPHLKKGLNLKKFFKMKRNQQVEVYSQDGNNLIYTEGKVTNIGRDFVMITNLKDRIWIPYEKINSANIPYGIPNYSNTHQHFLYDNNLRENLLYHFGATVSKRDALMQQFNEDSIRTNLERWKGTWIEVRYGSGEKYFGELVEISKDTLVLKFLQKNYLIPLQDLTYVQTVRFLHLLRSILKMGFKNPF